MKGRTFIGMFALICIWVGLSRGQEHSQNVEEEIRKVKGKIDTLRLHLEATEDILKYQERMREVLLGLRRGVETAIYRLKRTLSQYDRDIRRLNREIAKLRPVGELVEAWKKYREAGKTREAFVELYKTVRGEEPDRETLRNYDLYEVMIEREIRVKTAVAIGPALVEIGKLVLQIPQLGMAGITTAPRDLWKSTDELLEVFEGGLLGYLFLNKDQRQTFDRLARTFPSLTRASFGTWKETKAYLSQLSKARMGLRGFINGLRGKTLDVITLKRGVLVFRGEERKWYYLFMRDANFARFVKRQLDPFYYHKGITQAGIKLVVKPMAIELTKGILLLLPDYAPYIPAATKEYISEVVGKENVEMILSAMKTFLSATETFLETFQRFSNILDYSRKRYEKKGQKVAEELQRLAHKSLYGEVSEADRQSAYEIAVSERDYLIDLRNRLEQELSLRLKGLEKAKGKLDVAIGKCEAGISALRQRKKLISEIISRLKARMEELKALEVRKELKYAGVYPEYIDISVKPYSIAADGLTEYMLDLKDEASFELEAGLVKVEVYEDSVAVVSSLGCRPFPTDEVRITGAIVQDGTIVCRSPGVKYIKATTKGVVEVGGKPKIGVVSDEDTLKVLKVADVRYVVRKFTKNEELGSSLDLFEGVGRTEPVEELIGVEAVKVADGEREYWATPRNVKIYYELRVPVGNNIYTYKGTGEYVRLTSDMLDPEHPGLLRIWVLDGEGNRYFRKEVRVSLNYVKVEVPGPIPIGTEASCRVVVTGGANMGQYEVRWEISGGGAGPTRTSTEDVTISDRVSHFKRQGETWVAETRVGFTEGRIKGHEWQHEYEFDNKFKLCIDDAPFLMGATILPKGEGICGSYSVETSFVGPTSPVLSNLEILRWDLKVPILNADFFRPSFLTGIELGVELEFEGVKEKSMVPLNTFLHSSTLDEMREDIKLLAEAKVSGPAGEVFWMGDGTLGLREWGEPGRALLHVMFLPHTSFRASEKGALREVVYDALPLTFNKLVAEKVGDKYRLTVVGPADMSNYTARWWLLGGIERTESFRLVDGRWISEVPARRKFLEVAVVNHLGEEVGVFRKPLDPDVDKIKEAMVGLFSAYEQERIGEFLEYVSSDFLSTDESGRSYSQSQLITSVLGDFRNLEGIEFRVDAEPPVGRYDLARVKVHWSRRATLAVSGQEWLLKDRSSTLVFEYDETRERYLLTSIQGEPIFGLSAPTGTITVPAGSIVEGKPVQEVVVDKGMVRSTGVTCRAGSVKFAPLVFTGWVGVEYIYFASIDFDPGTKVAFPRGDSDGRLLIVRTPPSSYPSDYEFGVDFEVYPPRFDPSFTVVPPLEPGFEWEFVPPTYNQVFVFPAGERQTIWAKNSKTGLVLKVEFTVERRGPEEFWLVLHDVSEETLPSVQPLTVTSMSPDWAYPGADTTITIKGTGFWTGEEMETFVIFSLYPNLQLDERYGYVSWNEVAWIRVASWGVRSSNELEVEVIVSEYPDVGDRCYVIVVRAVILPDGRKRIVDQAVAGTFTIKEKPE